VSEIQPYYGDEEIGNFEFGQFGNIPEIDIEHYNGKVIVVVGVSTEEFIGEFDTPAKSLLHLMPEEDRTIEPWGMLLSKTSPAITQALGQLAKNGGRPFYARILKKQGNKFPYWTLEAVKAVYNTEGQIAGFRIKDGTVIDNSEASLPMPERKQKK
jgi:hypothetical protein